MLVLTFSGDLASRCRRVRTSGRRQSSGPFFKGARSAASNWLATVQRALIRSGFGASGRITAKPLALSSLFFLSFHSFFPFFCTPLHSLLRVVLFVFFGPLHRRPRLVCNLSGVFSPTQPSLRSKLRP